MAPVLFIPPCNQQLLLQLLSFLCLFWEDLSTVLAHSSRSQSAVLATCGAEQVTDSAAYMCATTDTHRLISVRFAEERNHGVRSWN